MSPKKVVASHDGVPGHTSRQEKARIIVLQGAIGGPLTKVV